MHARSVWVSPPIYHYRGRFRVAYLWLAESFREAQNNNNKYQVHFHKFIFFFQNNFLGMELHGLQNLLKVLVSSSNTIDTCIMVWYVTRWKAKINIYKDTVGPNLFEQAQLFPVHFELKQLTHFLWICPLVIHIYYELFWKPAYSKHFLFLLKGSTEPIINEGILIYRSL